MKERILFVNTDMCSGGIEVSLINLLQALDYTKYEVELLLLSKNLDFINRIPPACNIILLSQDDEDYKGKAISSYLNQLYAKNRNIIEFFLLRILRKINKNSFIKYIAQHFKSKTYDTTIAYRTGIVAEVVFSCFKDTKKINFYHNGSFERFPNDSNLYKQASCIVTVSEGMKEEILTQLPYLSKKLHVIGNICSTPEHLLCLKSHRATLTNKKIQIVSVERLVHDKGFDMLITACFQLRKKGFNIALVLVGGDDNTQFDKELSLLTNKLEMESFVTYTGAIDNPYHEMALADIYIQPSRIESFGITIREAQMLGLPIIATRTHGAAELIIDQHNGILCDKTISSISQAIEKLIQNDKLRINLSLNCSKTNWEESNKQISAKLEGIL